jgi:hypothetical protein
VIIYTKYTGWRQNDFNVHAQAERVAFDAARADPAMAERYCPGPRGRLSIISVFLCRSVLYGAFVWARRALKHQNGGFRPAVHNNKVACAAVARAARVDSETAHQGLAA